MNTKIETITGAVPSLQISTLNDIPAGDFTPLTRFLIKNITDDNITASIKTLDGNTVTTVLYPGWNPEICVAVYSVTANSLQYGY